MTPQTTDRFVLAMTVSGVRWADGKYPIADQWGRAVSPTIYLTPDGTGTQDDRLAASFASEAEAIAARDANGWPRQYVATQPPSLDYKGFFSATPASGEPNGWRGTSPPYVGYRVWDRHLEREISRHATREEAMAAIRDIELEG